MEEEKDQYSVSRDRVRIKDIARMANVSATTVSNVIHGNAKKVSEETARRVERILEECGYTPSVGALMLSGSGSRIIGVLAARAVKSVEQQAFTNVMIRALEEALFQRDYYMLLHFADSAEENLKFASAWKVEGLITLGISAPENQKLQARCKVPVVSIDVYYGDGAEVPNVGLDDFGGGYLMGAHLLECGHKKICFVSDNDVGVDHARWTGLRRACSEAGVYLTEKEHILIPAEPKRRKAFYKANLARVALNNDVLFFASDYYAMEAVGFLNDLEIKVPDEISVAGFDDSEFAMLCRPKLTTVRQNIPGKALAAVEKIFAFIKGDGHISMKERLPVSLVVRDSVISNNKI